MSADEASVELPLDGTGGRLRRAREAQGLSRTDIAQRTRIPERHLAAIEQGDFAALPGRTYVVGFVRTYARAVGLTEAPLIDALRAELGQANPEPPPAPAFEPGDPARVPGARLAWLAALAGLMTAVGGGVYWSGYSFTAPGLPSILPAETPAPHPAAPRPVAAPVALATNPVVLTAHAADIWLRISDATGQRLFEKQLALGESYTVPADAAHPRIWTGRPEALAITVGGRTVPPLADARKTVKDVEVSGMALLARAAATPVPGQHPGSVAALTPAAMPAAMPGGLPAAAASATPAAHAVVHHPRAPKPSPTPGAVPSAAASAPPAAGAAGSALQTSTVSQ